MRCWGTGWWVCVLWLSWGGPGVWAQEPTPWLPSRLLAPESQTRPEWQAELDRLRSRVEQLEQSQGGVPTTPPEPEPEERPGPVAAWLGSGSIMSAFFTPQSTAEPKPVKEKKWYEKYSLRGYTQFRSNEVLQRDPNLARAQHVGDRSIGDSQNFFIRRARLIFEGEISEHLRVYLQPDFAIQPPGSPDGTHFAQIRDWYGDVYLDTDKIHRLRIGQSKVPYGWENMQSSSNRVPLDRTDPLNSAVRNERDLGVFYYWTPPFAQELFKYVLDEGLKGSGNYGMFALGAYNGQGGSFVEQNNNVHVVSRFVWPHRFDNGQIIELAVQAYTGRYTVLSAPIRPLGQGPSTRPINTLERFGAAGVRDERLAWTVVVYPQPLGFQAEWNIGRGPALNAEQTAVEERALSGGYLMALYRLQTPCWGEFFPFLRWNYYSGGYKSERNAPYARINEWECGVEWQIVKALELTVGYTLTDRTNTQAIDQVGVTPYEQFRGQLLRIQFQINY